MKKLLKIGRAVWMWLCTCVVTGIVTVQGATLRWNTNPEPDIAFYTVYAESASGTVAREVAEAQLLLDGWLTNGSYTFYVTATSSAGLESERSSGMPYDFGTIAAPVITAQPAGQILASGSTLAMSVTATGASAVSYQWRKDGQALTGQTSANFSNSSITVSDSGVYTVVVSNAGGSVTSSPAQVVVQVPPSISTHPLSSSVPAASAVTLSVSASGTALRYQWFKDGGALPGRTNASFSIASMTAADQGTYRAVVTNLVGSASSATATLGIVYPPTMVAGPVGTNVATGGTIQLTATVSGTAPFTYQWIKDSQPIANAVGSQLVITGASSSHSGSYQVRVSNAASSVTSAAAVVSVLDRPAIATQPTSTDVLMEAGFTLSVVAQGSGVLSYQWYLNDVPLAGATSASYQVPSASAGNAGEYTVIIANAAGSVTSQTATVRVFPRITIVQQPASTNLQVGGQLTLVVQATGPTPLSFQWFRETVVLNGATNAQLQIAQVSSTDAGSYTVEISNALERVPSIEALVTISGEAPTILTQPTGGNYLEGTNLTLAVAATSPTPMSYQWFLNGSAITGATASMYQKSSAQTADSGSYTVRVANSNGAVNSAPASVSVLQPIVIVQSPTGTNVVKGGRITLWVDATGPAGMTYQWHLNGVKLNGKTSSSLTVSSASLSDGGIYTCRITSPVETKTTLGAEVIVIDTPNASDCILTLSVGGDGSLVITGVAPVNTSYELQRSDSLTAPNWTRMQNVSSRTDGRFQVTVPMSTVSSGFIRTIRRTN